MGKRKALMAKTLLASKKNGLINVYMKLLHGGKGIER